MVTSLAGFAGARRPHPPGARTGDAGGLQISPRRFPPNACFLLDAPQRPAQPSQRDDLLSLFFAQDIAHVDGGYPSAGFNVLTAFLLAGFQVTLIGRFWVSPRSHSGKLHAANLCPFSGCVEFAGLGDDFGEPVGEACEAVAGSTVRQGTAEHFEDMLGGKQGIERHPRCQHE